MGRIGNQVSILSGPTTVKRESRTLDHWHLLGRRTEMMIFEPEDLPVVIELACFYRLRVDEGKVHSHRDCGLFLSSIFYLSESIVTCELF